MLVFNQMQALVYYNSTKCFKYEKYDFYLSLLITSTYRNIVW